MQPPIKVVSDRADAETDNGSREPMTAEQKAELAELCERHGEEMDTSLTEKQAQARISTLKDRDGD